MLEVEDIHTSYGLSQVLFGVSLHVEPGEVVSLIGRNGVGKTTTLRSIMGLTPPRQGRIRWMAQDITGLPPYRIARLGIGFVPEDRRIFPDLTVWENLDIARDVHGIGWSEAQVYELFPDLASISQRRGGMLSGGQQQMLAIARSLMANPQLLLLDEPSEGLAPRLVEALTSQIGALKKNGMSIILAEQNLDFVLALSDRLHILEKGQIKYSGTTDDVRGNQEVVEKYLAV